MDEKRDIAKDRAKYPRVCPDVGCQDAFAHYISRTEVAEAALERAIGQLREARWCPPKATCRMRVKGQRAGAEDVCIDCWLDYLTKEGEEK